MSSRPPRVVAFGFLGMGNIGNEASFEAVRSWLTDRFPSADLTCVCAEPEVVMRLHGVPGTTIMSYRAEPGEAGFAGVLRKGLGRLRDLPRTFSWVNDADVVLVPGMGVLEATLGANPWGLPYWQFLTALACRIRRRTMVLVSVGAEDVPNLAVRSFYRWTVRWASYCSFRDTASRSAMTAAGAPGRPGSVYPDLAFALPGPDDVAPEPGHIVIGVMTYTGPPGSRVPADIVVASYVAQMCEAITRLLTMGRSVTLVVGDLADLPLADRIAAAVSKEVPKGAAERLAVSRADTLMTIMAEMVRAEVIVASRFHNVIAGLKVARPTVSLGYAAKNRRLLTEFGLGGYAQPMDDFDVDTLLTHIERARAAHAGNEAHMREVLDRYRSELNHQFEVLERVLLDAAPPGR